MSSILEALKKIENRPSQNDNVKICSDDIYVIKNTLHESIKKRWLYYSFIPTGFLVITVGFLFWMLYSYKLTPYPKQTYSNLSKNDEQTAKNKNKVNVSESVTLSNEEKSKVAKLHKEKKKIAQELNTQELKDFEPEKKSKKNFPEENSSIHIQSGDKLSFKLQAIFWSDNPKGRIAVINDKIVREGDFIENRSVKQIAREHVIINAQNKKWKLKFK